MPDVLLKDEFGIEQPYEDINAVLLNTVDGGTATYISPVIIPAQIQADMAQTDKTAVDYIKNKPNNYPASMITGLVVGELPRLDTGSYQFTYSDDFECYIYELPGAWDGLSGFTYKITWDGEEFTCICKHVSEASSGYTDGYYIGNFTKIFNLGSGEDTGEPFGIIFSSDGAEAVIYTDNSQEWHTLGIFPAGDDVKKLDHKYLPDDLATQEWVNNEISKIDVGGSGNVAAIIDILPEQELTFESEEPSTFLTYGSIGEKDNEFLQTLSVIKPDETYYVVIDGVEYECVAQDVIKLMEQTGEVIPENREVYANAILGNLGLVGINGMTDTGEPFVLQVVSITGYKDDGSIYDTHMGLIGIKEEESISSIAKTVHIYQKSTSSNLPEFTTEDEGKVLGIKDGAVSWVNVESSVTVKEEDILPEQEFTFTPVDGDAGLFQFMTDTKESGLLQILSVLKPGETYYIVVDGVEYECTAQSCFESGVPRPADSEIYADAVLGNIGIADPEFTNTGEPFTIMVLSFAQFSDNGSISNENHNAAIGVTGDASAESVTRSVRIYKKIEESNNYIKWDELIREDNVTTEIDLFEKQTINTFIEDSNYGGVYAAGMNFPESGYTNDLVASFDLEIGESYIVEWDGATYSVVGQDGSAVMPNTTILGDGSSFGIGESTGEPFVIGVVKNSGVLFASLTETIDSHTIRIYTSTSSVETNIKSEFLPSHLQFGKVNGTFTLIDGTCKCTYTEDNGWMRETIPITSDIHLTDGNIYTVIWDGTEYTCKCSLAEGIIPFVGNPVNITGEDNGMPFSIAEDKDGVFLGISGFHFEAMELSGVDTSVTTEVTYSIKITYNGVVTKKIDTEYLYQTDWDENNKSSASYLQNRPFGMIPAGTVMAERTSVNCSLQFGENAYAAFIPTVGFIPGVTYRIELDGMSVDLTAEDFGEEGIGVVAGGRSIIDNFNNSAITILICTTQGTHTYKVTVIEDAIKKIDPKYLPDDIGGSSLPEVTTDDDGKVMTVVDGVWAAQTNTHPVELPEVTTADAGKFLRVDSSGNWVAETISNAEGVSF